MALADALNAFAEAIKALDARIAALEVKCECCQKSDCCPAVPAIEAPAVVDVEAPAVAEAPAGVDAEVPAVAEAPAVVDAEAPAVADVEAPAVADNETLFDLDTFGPDTIQNELWQQFRASSDAGKVSVVVYHGEEARNIIVYADVTTQPVYRNAGLAELRIIQAIAGTHIATLQPGESVKTACGVDGMWACV
jgi:hypothetical protein